MRAKLDFEPQKFAKKLFFCKNENNRHAQWESLERLIFAVICV